MPNHSCLRDPLLKKVAHHSFTLSGAANISLLFENPNAVDKVPLHDAKVKVRGAVSRYMFVYGKMNGISYVLVILAPIELRGKL